MRLVKLGGHLWAAGLDWFQVSSKKRDLSQLRNEALKLKAEADIPDMAAIRPRQYGFGFSAGIAGYRAANPLAGGIRLPSSSFLGVFHLKDIQGESFWWVCAVRQGLISGQGDTICGSREEAEKQLAMLTDLLGGFDEQVACATWTESEAWFTPLLTYRRTARLRPLTGNSCFRRRLIAAGLAACLLLAGSIGLRAYMFHKEEQQALLASRQQAQAREQRRADLLAHPERQFPMPWTTAQPIRQTARECFDSMFSLPLSLGGWHLAGARCDGHTLTAFWDFQQGGDYRLLPPDAVLETSTRARSTVRLVSAPVGTRRDGDFRSLSNTAHIRRHFYQLTANIGAHLSRFDFEKPEKTVVDKMELVAPWVRGFWELSGVPDALARDGSLAAALDVPGLIVTGVEYEHGWILKGEVYATPR